MAACSCLRGPRLVTLENSTETTLDIKWTPVASTSVNQYTVQAMPVQNYGSDLGPSQEWKYTSSRQARLLGLSPGTLYNVSVWADTADGASDATSTLAWTEIGEPDMPPVLQVLSRNGTQMTVQVSPGVSSKGPISAYRLVAFERDSLMAFSMERLAGHQEATEAGTPFYVAAELGPEWGGRAFVIGDGRSYGGFLNAPLSPNAEYLPIQGVGSTLNNDDVSPFSAGSLQLGEGADLGAFYAQLRSMLPMVPRSRLLVSDTTLGQGRFGPVRAAILVTDKGRKVPVNVQRCPAEWMLPDHERRTLLGDIEGMLRLGTHPNVVQFMGACEDEPEVLQLAVEQPSSSLRGLLLTSRHGSEGRVSGIAEDRLVDMLVSLAAGMHHLATRGVQHGQLSSRSVTIVEPLVPKISHFGLARYSPLGKRLDFTRWMAPETLRTNSHTEKSDVHRLMEECWRPQARDRPTFQELHCSLQALQPGALQFTYHQGYVYDKFNPLADEA
ncbi:hypothetical protein HPB48_000843 [Haemaphysalis longicornis]|uniref:Receptor protein-tyrosine kinase n=1 Tax=Haemaphysalis longicornis TaxID=44386 RepID=A0A9J6FVD6_HAELO|nr:hypothetical protein HPB48_000843 [Haemaphysalis longicornis]